MRRILATCHVLVGLAAALWLVAASSAFAKSEIEITAHSQTDFAVYKGDELNLSLQATGDGLEYKWIRSGTKETFCREATCKVDTGDWGLGSHRVVVVVLNTKGSLFLKYTIRVLAAPAGYKPGKVTPPLVEAGQGIEQISADDFTVKMVQGRGYSYHKKKVQVVGPLPRALEWSERLRTKAGSTMRLARDGGESHILAPKTAVQLAQSQNGRRALQLKGGTIRSRNLSSKDPRWSIVVGDWLQVDTDARGDVLVTTEEAAADAEDEDKDPSGLVRIVVLRGAARVYLSKSGANAGEGIVLAQGTEVQVKKGQSGDFELRQPDAQKVQKHFRETTPEYLLGRKPTDEGKGLTILQDKTVKTVANAVELATAANGQRDYMVTIEAFALVTSDIKGNAEANLLLADAYRGLYLYDSAVPAYQAAAEADPEAAAPHFGLGMLELHQKHWDKAIEQFEAADDRDYPDAQRLDYYLGVAHYNAKDPVGARSAFTYSLWDPRDPDVAQSAKEFRNRLTSDGWLDLRFGAGLFNDSNVLRGDGPKSSGYLGNVGFTLWPSRSDGFHFYLGFDAIKTGYANKDLKDLGRLDQKLGLGLGVGLGGGEGEKPLLAFDLDAYARTIMLGEERAMDIVSTKVTLGSPRLLDLALSAEAVTGSDPLPARDDVLDPLLDEVVPAGDRSRKISIYGLGLKPIDGEVVHLGLDVRSGKAAYKTDLHKEEDYKDLTTRLSLGLTTSLRNEFDLGVAQLKRTFDTSPDSRKDARLTLDLGWKWYFTTALYHRLTLENESQTSNREGSGFKRRTVMYKLNLDF